MTWDLVMVGRGESIKSFDWDIGEAAVMAVSSGITECRGLPDLWCCLDAAGYFPDELADSPVIAKHVPLCGGGYKADEPDRRKWYECPNVTYWGASLHPFPLFARDVTCEHCGTPPAHPRFSAGHAKYKNSLLMAVQVAGQLGFRRVLMTGVDFIGNREILDMLKWWHRDIATPLGIEWSVTSERSGLSEFLPVVCHSG